MKLSSFVLLVVVAIALHGTEARRVYIKDGKFYLDDDAFFAQGVGYAPVPIGIDITITPPYGDYFTKNYETLYKRDLALLRPLGVNLLRLWGWNIGADHSDFLDLAYNKGVDPIFVAPEFWMGPSSYGNLADPTVQQKVLADFQVFIKTAKNHPAIMFYILGSDLNADWNYSGQLDALFSLLQQLAQAAHGYNASNIVTTALNDLNSLSTISHYDANLSIDFWGLNVYRGCTFGDLFSQFGAVSSKPLFVSEYGIDSYDDLDLAENDTMQAECVGGLAKELVINNQTTIGGAVVEYVDEYWKGKLGIYDGRHTACPDNNPSHHSNCGSPNAAFPDKYVNQAWFGIVNSAFAPRAVYTTLQKLWTKS